jgi:hypothetical protein
MCERSLAHLAADGYDRMLFFESFGCRSCRRLTLIRMTPRSPLWLQKNRLHSAPPPSPQGSRAMRLLSPSPSQLQLASRRPQRSFSKVSAGSFEGLLKDLWAPLVAYSPRRIHLRQLHPTHTRIQVCIYNPLLQRADDLEASGSTSSSFSLSDSFGARTGLTPLRFNLSSSSSSEKSPDKIIEQTKRMQLDIQAARSKVSGCPNTLTPRSLGPPARRYRPSVSRRCSTVQRVL